MTDVFRQWGVISDAGELAATGTDEGVLEDWRAANMPLGHVEPIAVVPLGNVTPALPSRLERLALDAALERAGGNKVEAARLLGCGKSTLYRKLNRHQEEPRE